MVIYFAYIHVFLYIFVYVHVSLFFVNVRICNVKDDKSGEDSTVTIPNR